MVSLTSLWLPILLSAVVVFVASALSHMVLTYHRSDFKKLPSEDQIMEALRKFDIPAGDYLVPFPGGPADMQKPEFKDKWKRGPQMIATVWKLQSMAIGAQLAQWFVMTIVVSVFAAYVASRALGPGAAYLKVSQMASTTAFLAYAMASWADVIWYRRSWVTAAKNTVDGVVYGLLTGGVFGWLWP